MGKRDEALHGGGSLVQRYVTIFFILARLAVNIRQIALIVLYFKSISTTNQGLFCQSVIIGGVYMPALRSVGGLKNVKK